MIWNVTLLMVHIFALLALAMLFKNSPDALQRIVIGLLFASTGVYICTGSAALLGYWSHWLVGRIAFQIEHIAVLLYVFRLFVQDQERRCLPSSLVSFRNLLR